MANFGFYGVYGRDGGGVYTDWGCFERIKRQIPGVKVKKFLSRPEAVNYIIDGLANVYCICKESEIQVALLYTCTNCYLREEKLICYRMGALEAPPFAIRI